MYSFTSFVTRKNKDNSIFVGNQVSYKEKATTTTNEDGTISKLESMGFLNDGFTSIQMIKMPILTLNKRPSYQ